jgi:hypothetical protein
VEAIPNHDHHVDLVYFAAARPGPEPSSAEGHEMRWHSLADLDAGHLTDEIRLSSADAIRFVQERLAARR